MLQGLSLKFQNFENMSCLIDINRQLSASFEPFLTVSLELWGYILLATIVRKHWDKLKSSFVAEELLLKETHNS